MDASTGKFGRYQARERLRSGIYRARAADGRNVMVKRLSADLAAEPEHWKRFIDEARTLARLKHPNVVRLLDAKLDVAEPFLAVEYVHGANLGELLARAEQRGVRIPVTLALWIAREALLGLHHAHTRTRSDGTPAAIVHGDLSPESLLVSFEGHVKVAGFGVRTPVNASKAVRYMSPERMKGGRLDARADVYSLGHVLLAMLAGKHPILGDTIGEVLPRVMRGVLPRPSMVNEAATPEIDSLVRRAIEPAVTMRWQDAEEVADMIEVLLGRDIHLHRRKLESFLGELFPERQFGTTTRRERAS